MKKSLTEEQIIGVLKEAEAGIVLFSPQIRRDEVKRAHQISQAFAAR